MQDADAAGRPPEHAVPTPRGGHRTGEYRNLDIYKGGDRMQVLWEGVHDRVTLLYGEGSVWMRVLVGCGSPRGVSVVRAV